MKNLHKLFLLLILSGSVMSCSYKSDFDQAAILSGTGVTLQNHGTTIVVNPPSPSKTALIFYPGGYVNYEAYLPLMVKCAQKGIKCFIVQMPSDLAILEINSANPYQADYPEINHWYICGHSLGGAMAATYVARHKNKFKGLVLLAAYSTDDLKHSGVKVLSIYGSNDGVLNKEKYEKYKSNLPNNFEEKIIAGGNHCNFGSYGFQSGDNAASITAEKQKQDTADFIGDFCK